MKVDEVKRVEPTFDDIRKWYEENLSPDVLDLDDQRVYENVFHEGRWAAIFQCTESGMQRLMQRAKPRSITDLAAVTSIYRPGPLAAGVDRMYVDDKAKAEAGEKLEYEHPVIERVLDETYGHMIFQEHFMLLGREFGLSWDDCDRLRKILVKKSIGTDVNEEKRRKALEIRDEFFKGAMEAGMSREQVEDLWQRMEYFSGYGFNKSLVEGTRVVMSDGSTKPIERIEAGDEVVTRDELTGELTTTAVVQLHDHGVQNVTRYVFEDGSTITCTSEHKVRTSDGRMLPIRRALEEGLDVVSFPTRVESSGT